MTVSGWITTGKAMEILNINRWMLYRLTAEGKIARVRSAKFYVYREVDVRRLVGQPLGPAERTRNEKGQFELPGLIGADRFRLVLARDLDEFL